MKDWYLSNVRKELDHFIRFSIVGAVWTAVNIAIMWLLIDVLGLAGWLGSTIGIAVLYIGRYYNYLWLKVIEPKFWKYVYASGLFSLFMIAGMTVAVDVLGYKAFYPSIILTALSFILKFLFFKRIKLLKGNEHRD